MDRKILALTVVLTAFAAMAQEPETPAGAPQARPQAAQPSPTPGRGGRGGGRNAANPNDDNPTGRGSEGNRVFLGLGPKPDLATALKGEPIFQANCASCHGADARGTGKGPSLIRSVLVITDIDGSQVGPVIAKGRGAMPAFANFTPDQMHQLQQYMAQLVEDVANRGTYSYLPNLQDGVAAAGKTFFDQNCAACHSATGDLKGFGKGKPYQVIQRAWLAPRAQPATVTVTSARQTITGRLQSMDDFDIVFTDAGGVSHDVARDKGVSVVIDDPMAVHNRLAGSLTNADMHDVTAYLETLQ